MPRHARSLVTIALLITLLMATSAAAGQFNHHRKGLFLGVDVGAGGSYLEYEKNGQKYESEEDSGGALGLRFGYAFNPYFSLAIEGRGYGHADDDFDYGIGSTTLMATMYPMGGGFFLRVGLGGAVLKTEVPSDTDDELIGEFEEEGGVIALGLGYEWMVSEHFGVGLALDARGGATEDFGEFEDVGFAESTLGLTMNYFF